ncbi:hypothetical protein LEP1GSC058_1049 [Leptospira fainei serovar Hurstbridge str. BUT 6]|uniref:Uncharacterized protein n=1 Tax=Leptospira fainei serovar Hurstbridge str. BUT 6 TaxID=1193011 RepID=S3UTG8_9LEPT|nr:hypothetical protein [Leptospira fainei]EPG72533.1 hypothetical protein LEP1GSC058_1049 [Leptospira fainei serovar Hurstbridge str. BUT 6]
MNFLNAKFGLPLIAILFLAVEQVGSSPANIFPRETPESKPLLRVLPAFRKEECDWAIRWDICLKCVRNGVRYAQRIHFFPSGPYREHGCYTEEKGFFLLEED